MTTEDHEFPFMFAYDLGKSRRLHPEAWGSQPAPALPHKGWLPEQRSTRVGFRFSQESKEIGTTLRAH